MDKDTQLVIKHYQLTVIILSAVILSCFLAFMYVVVVYVPDIVAQANARQLDPMIRAAVSEQFDAYIDSVNK